MNTKVIKAYMALNSITQKEMASRLGMTPPTFNRKINGKVNFSSSELELMLKILKIEPNDLFFTQSISKVKII